MLLVVVGILSGRKAALNLNQIVDSFLDLLYYIQNALQMWYKSGGGVATLTQTTPLVQLPRQLPRLVYSAST